MMKASFAKTFAGRTRSIFLFFLVVCVILWGRLFQLSIVRHQEYVRLAARQHGVTKELASERGVIFAVDKTGATIPLAINKTEKVLVVSPRAVRDQEVTAGAVAEAFGLDRLEILKKISKTGDPYEVLARRIAPEEAEAFAGRGIPGISFEDETRRAYPNGSMAARILGFVAGEAGEAKGQYGLEGLLNTELAGEAGILKGAKDASGFLVALGRRIVHPPKNGSSVTLTMDYNIQRKAEDVLAAAREKWGGSGGFVMVTDPTTGRILAQATAPAYDPNAYFREHDYGVFLNPAVEASYELGSVLKPITMAAAINEGVVTPESTYRDTGEARIGGYTIRNFDGKAYDVQTMMQVVEKSLNTGMVHVSRLLGHERHLSYLKTFGFGEKTGVDLPGEISGNISNLLAGRDIDFATASFGQGIAVTPIQLAAAMGAIANDGVLLRPYIVEKITDDSGNAVITRLAAGREVIRKDTAEAIQKMLVSAVRSGFENRAGVAGYFVAGKTGTAQVPLKNNRGYSDAVTHTFAGFVPAFAPRFLIVLQLNEPEGNRFAANTLTPAFHDLAAFILNYYEIPPDEK